MKQAGNEACELKPKEVSSCSVFCVVPLQVGLMTTTVWWPPPRGVPPNCAVNTVGSGAPLAPRNTMEKGREAASQVVPSECEQASIQNSAGCGPLAVVCKIGGEDLI